jgi:hypothetical protein
MLGLMGRSLRDRWARFRWAAGVSIGLFVLGVVLVFVISAQTGTRVGIVVVARGNSPTGNGLMSVACPSRGQCTAITSDGREVTFDPVSPGRPLSVKINERGQANAVSCPSAGECTAVDDGTGETVFDPISSGGAITTPIGSAAVGDVTAVACPAAGQCTAVATNFEISARNSNQYLGVDLALTFNPGSRQRP